MSNAIKSFEYRVFDLNGNYLTNWKDVISTPSFSWEINNGVGEMVIRLARPFNSFGEGADVWFENEVRVYVSDKESNSSLIYSGRMNEWRPHFGVDGEYVDVQCLGYATQLDDRILRDRLTSPDFVYNQYSTAGLAAAAGWSPASEISMNMPGSYSVFGFGTGRPVKTFAMRFQPSLQTISAMAIEVTGLVNTPQDMVLGLMYADTSLSGAGNVDTAVVPGVVLASGVVSANTIASGVRNKYTAVFPQTLAIDTGKQYFGFVSGSGIQVYSWGQGLYANANGSFGNYMYATISGAENRVGYGYATTGGSGDFPYTGLEFETRYDNTAPTFSGIDPFSMVQDILGNKYSGKVSFNAALSQSTGSTVTYQINKQTVKESIQKATELAPPFWYWRVDASNRLTFKRRDDTTLDHTLNLGKEIVDAAPIRSVNELKTRIVFYGGSDVGKPELIYTDDRIGMQTSYTLKEQILRDGRVQKSDSAALLTSDFFDSKGSPILAMQVKVMDSNGDQKFGYDIESFLPGQRVMVIDPKKDSYNLVYGTWDEAIWDTNSWDDADLYMLATPLQIIRVEYMADYAVLTLAEQTNSAARTIEEDRRSQQQNETANAPLI